MNKKFFLSITDVKANIFCCVNMLIKYRSDLVHSARNIRCMNTTGRVVRRTIVHMKSSFTFKRRISKWQRVIWANRSEPKMNIFSKNGVLALPYNHADFENPFEGVIHFAKYLFNCFCSHPEKSDFLVKIIQI